MNLVCDGRRRLGRGHQARPGHGHKTRQDFIHRGHIRQGRVTLFATHCDDLELFLLDLRHGGGQALEHQVHLARHEVGVGGRAAFVGNVDDIQTGGELEQFPGQVGGGARTAGGVIELAGVGLGVGDQFPQVVGWHLGVGQQHIRVGGDHRDGNKLVRVVAQFFVKALVDGERPGGRQHQGVAITGGVKERLGANVAASADPVFDDDRLTPLGLQPLADDARQGVRSAARRHGHDDLDRARRVVLRLHQGRSGQGQGCGQGQAQASPKFALHRWVSFVHVDLDRQGLAMEPWNRGSARRA